MENIYVSSLRMLVALAVVVIGIIILYRYSNKLKFNIKDREHTVQKIDTIHLGYRKFVSVLQVKDRLLVLGVGDKEMCLLADLKSEEKSQ
jgi:flagellar biogenesis protein FliO